MYAIYILFKILGALERVAMWVWGVGGEHGDSRESCPLQPVKILGLLRLTQRQRQEWTSFTLTHCSP